MVYNIKPIVFPSIRCTKERQQSHKQYLQNEQEQERISNQSMPNIANGLSHQP